MTSADLSSVIQRTAQWPPSLVTEPLATWWAPVARAAHSVYEWVVLGPLARLYLHGAGWGSVGFWRGVTLPVICTQLTGLPSDFWTQNAAECLSLVSRQFYAVVVVFETVVYFVVLCGCVKWVLSRLCQKRGVCKRSTPKSETTSAKPRTKTVPT